MSDELVKHELRLPGGRTRICFLPKGQRPDWAQRRSGIAQFKPLKIKHGTKEGSPMLYSRKEVNQWLNKHNLISPLFTD